MHDGTNHSGFLTLEELLPEGLLDAYDTSPFQDLLSAEFDTGLLDITKQAGQDNIFNTIMGGQTSYMQVPGQASAAGASGFAGADSSRGLITAQGAQRGMFADITEATLGAKKADITALEGLKDRAFNMFTDIQLDMDMLDPDGDGDGGTPTVYIGSDGISYEFGGDGVPTGDSVFGTTVYNDSTGQLWYYGGGGWQLYEGDLPGDTGGDDGVTPPNPPNPPDPPNPPGGGGDGGGLGCFLAGTMILTGDGTEIPIEEIKKGMEVYAYDEESAELKLSKVSKTFFHPKENTYLVINDNLLVTPNHPVLNNNKWVEIGELGEGDMLTDKDNNPIPISKIKEVNELSDVFNFEVEKYHTYVAEGIIVHNKGIEDPGGGDGDIGGGNFGDDFFWPTGG
jgi:hypothetical protein